MINLEDQQVKYLYEKIFNTLLCHFQKNLPQFRKNDEFRRETLKRGRKIANSCMELVEKELGLIEGGTNNEKN